MVESSWGNWFIEQEIELVEPDGLSVWFIGCNGFVLRSSETTLYIDPYFGGSVPPRLLRMAPVPINPTAVKMCDAVLITHEHLDHMHPPSYLPLIKGTDADIYASSDSWKKSKSSNIQNINIDDRKESIEPGDKITINDVTIHVREGNDPDAIGEVTYVVEHESGTFFHAGDSRVSDEFKEIGEEFNIDLGVLAIGSETRWYREDQNKLIERRKVYMDHDEVIECSNYLQMERLAPSHYRMWKGVSTNISTLADHSSSFMYPKVIEPIEVGDRLILDSPGIVPQNILNQ